MRHFIALFIGTLVLSWGAAASAQCSCEQTRDRDESFRAATYVFYGEAQTNEDGELRLRVVENYKGTRDKRTHPVNGTDCGFEFEEGQRYMVYADKGEGRRAITVDRCGTTTQVDHQPLTAMIWTLADELVYGTSRRWTARHAAGRRQLTERSVGKIKWSIKKCDDRWKEAKLTAKIEVRFDIQPDGAYKHELVSYEMPTETNPEVRQCLEEKLAEDKFDDFRGGPVSVSAYWIVDRIDRSFGQDKASAVVVPFGTTSEN